MTLISIKSAPVLSTFGDNFREENGKKILVRVIFAESIYRCMLLFLDHILCRRAHFIRGALCVLQAVLAIIGPMQTLVMLHGVHDVTWVC